jgi:hypothetical protein
MPGIHHIGSDPHFVDWLAGVLSRSEMDGEVVALVALGEDSLANEVSVSDAEWCLGN